MKKLTQYLAKAQLALGSICLVVFVLATLVQVISRYLGISMLWTEEVAVNAFIWAMFLGAAVMVREKQHFSFGVLTDKLTGVKKSILVIVQNVIMLVFCILCSIYSIEITDVFWNSKWISIPGFKQGYVWLALPVTFISSSLYLLENIYDELKKFYWFKGYSWN
uniref:TRAP transporter small permease n=1 Tax=Thaumasiovibrio occultus TaxID=1891184 RepID=UPI000B352CC8|nr:TRAP transporter small permease [Thaumasiovibrio occultus]